MKLYRVTTTFFGAGEPSGFYFDDMDKAEKFLSQCDNGEIEEFRLIADYELNYSDGCTLCDLTFGNFDAKKI